MLLDVLPSESDIVYMCDTFMDDVEDYIKDEYKKTFKQRFEFLLHDIMQGYEPAYGIFEAIEPLKEELERY